MTVFLVPRGWLSQFFVNARNFDLGDSPLQKHQPRSQGSLLPVPTERERTWERGCRNTRENGHKLWVQ